MLDDGDRLTGEDGLIDPKGGRVDVGDTDIGRDLVTDRHLNQVTGHDLFRAHLLDAGLVLAHHLAHLRLVLLEGLNGRLGVTLLPYSHHGVGYQDK